MITLRIVGEPKAQPRPRATRRGKVYNPTTAQGWRDMICLEVARQRLVEQIQGPLQVDCIWYFPRPKSHYRGEVLREDAPKFHVYKPDRDNLDKVVLDALEESGLIKNDCQVCAGILLKAYVGPEELPGVRIQIQEL